MILNNETLKEKELVTFGDDAPYIVLDTKHLYYADDCKTLELGIELLNKITVYNKINHLCRDLQSDFKLDTKVLYKAIEHIQDAKPFTENDLKHYFEQDQEFNKFGEIACKMIDIDPLWSSIEIDMYLMGVSVDKLVKMNEEKNKEHTKCLEGFVDLYMDFMHRKYSFDQFIPRAKEILFLLIKV